MSNYSNYNLVNEQFTELENRYEFCFPVGEGTYGIVAGMLDKTNDELVAVKKLIPHRKDNYEVLQMLREVKILKKCEHPNILKLNGIILGARDCVYLITDLMCCDLKQLIKSKQRRGFWMIDEIRSIMVQLNSALAYMHKRGIIHRDLKPENILVDTHGTIKICDLGLARHVSSKQDPLLTEYVVSRFYRAPEVMLSSCRYTQAIDMWAVGIICSELFLAKVPFQGNTWKDQLLAIFAVLGSPRLSDISYVTSEKALNFVLESQTTHCITIEKLLENVPPEAVDFISKLFDYNSERRLTARQALEHPFLVWWASSFEREISRSLSKRRSAPSFEKFDFVLGQKPVYSQSLGQSASTEVAMEYDNEFSFELNARITENEQELMELLRRETLELDGLAPIPFSQSDEANK